MALNPLDLMEPEETVGDLWHSFASQIDAPEGFADQAVAMADIRPSLSLIFRALDGADGVELGESPATPSFHRLGIKRKLGTQRETVHLARFDGERLRLPPVLDVFSDKLLNKAAYLWMVACATVSKPINLPKDQLQADLLMIDEMHRVVAPALAACPGLRVPYARLCADVLVGRNRPMLPRQEAFVEAQLVKVLNYQAPADYNKNMQAPLNYQPMKPVPFWLQLGAPKAGTGEAQTDEEAAAPPNASVTSRKLASRENRDEANRKDSFIMHRFESILSWAESMNLNRSVDDDDDEAAQKAADDQDQIALSRHDRKVATRLRLHLDLSPDDADHERLAGEGAFYPEWDHRSKSYMPNHCRVLEVEADTHADHPLVPNPRRLREVRRQFEALHPRRIMRPRQIEGSELDLDALIEAQVNLRATGSASDRIYQSMRRTDRDLSVAFLLDTSRSTEAAIGDSCVIDVARESLAALAGGIDASGDRLGIWGFSSLKRDRVFIKRCKGFDTQMSGDVTARICALSPCHYTRLGAAIRHMSAKLDEEQSSRKLLLVLTDGKPNDLDHYEGIHGIEDSHKAVSEARRKGQVVHGIIIDEDGQDWFARIFGRGGFTLLPEPERLTRALPQIYRNLTQT
ncbi:MAG: NorD nitric oxide reductase activation protein [Hyphomicrobiales bacterium]|nr:MAG: NorD nitric oxide reductase activation protein [Hyphomicrobiales bacterium]